MTRTDIDESVTHRLTLIEGMLRHAQVLCGNRLANLCDLAVASPGLIVSLYLEAREAIEASGAPEDAKIVMRRSVQFQVTQLLDVVLTVVSAEDPRQALAEHWTQPSSLGESVH
jgi:hypothetical protein